MPYSAIDVANYIIKRAIDLKKPISNIRLQKLLYYLQARFLVENEQPLFNDAIERWKYGPVVPEVYHEYKSYGSSNINKVSQVFRVIKDVDGNIKEIVIDSFDEKAINEDDQDFIGETVDLLDDFGSFELVDHTHQQELWNKYEQAILCNLNVSPYDIQEIKAYFQKDEREQLWNKK